MSDQIMAGYSDPHHHRHYLAQRIGAGIPATAALGGIHFLGGSLARGGRVRGGDLLPGDGYDTSTPSGAFLGGITAPATILKDGWDYFTSWF